MIWPDDKPINVAVEFEDREDEFVGGAQLLEPVNEIEEGDIVKKEYTISGAIEYEVVKILDKDFYYTKSYLENVNFLQNVSPYIQNQYDDIYIFNNFFYQFMSIYYTAIHTISIFFKNNIVIDEGLKFNEHVTQSEDTDLYLRAAKSNIVGFYNEQLSVYRMHNNNITKNIVSALKDFTAVHLKNYYRYFLYSNKTLKKQYKKKLASKYNSLAYLLLLDKRNKEARQAFIKAFHLSPNKAIFKNLIKSSLPWSKLRQIFKNYKNY